MSAVSFWRCLGCRWQLQVIRPFRFYFATRVFDTFADHIAEWAEGSSFVRRKVALLSFFGVDNLGKCRALGGGKYGIHTGSRERPYPTIES